MSCKIRRKITKKPVNESVVLNEDKIYEVLESNQTTSLTLIENLYGSETLKRCKEFIGKFRELVSSQREILSINITLFGKQLPEDCVVVDYSKITEYLASIIFNGIKSSRVGVDLIDSSITIDNGHIPAFDIKSVSNNIISHGHGVLPKINNELHDLLQCKNETDFIKIFRDFCTTKEDKREKHISDILIFIYRDSENNFNNCFIVPFICCIRNLVKKNRLTKKGSNEVGVNPPGLLCDNVETLMTKLQDFSIEKIKDDKQPDSKSRKFSVSLH